MFLFEVCLVKLLTTVSTPRVTYLNPHYTRIKVAQLSERTPLPAAYLGTNREQMANTINSKTHMETYRSIGIWVMLVLFMLFNHADCEDPR